MKTEPEQTTTENEADPAGTDEAPNDPRNSIEAENEMLRSMLRTADAREEIVDALKQAGARSPGLLFAYVVDKLQFDDEGKLANGAALLEHISRTFPEQFGASAAGSSVDAGAGTARVPVLLTKEALAKMKPAEIALLDWADVKATIAGRR